MSMIDHLDVLSDRQTIAGKVHSTYCKHLTAPVDWGAGGAKRHVMIVAHGANTLGDISFQLQGYNEADLSDAFVIDETTVIKQADVVEGSVFWLEVKPTGKRYQNLAVFYNVGTAAGAAAKAKDAAQGEQQDPVYCPIEPIMGQPESKENTYSAALTLDRTDNVPFDVNNQDKVLW